MIWVSEAWPKWAMAWVPKTLLKREKGFQFRILITCLLSLIEISGLIRKALRVVCRAHETLKTPFDRRRMTFTSITTKSGKSFPLCPTSKTVRSHSDVRKNRTCTKNSFSAVSRKGTIWSFRVWCGREVTISGRSTGGKSSHTSRQSCRRAWKLSLIGPKMSYTTRLWSNLS